MKTVTQIAETPQRVQNNFISDIVIWPQVMYNSE